MKNLLTGKFTSNTKRTLVIVAVVLQVLVLVGMAAQREAIRAFGQTVYLRSAPIDPRDPFRGDFVRLDYLMSVVNKAQMRDIPEEYLSKKGRVVYAVLKEEGNGLFSLDYLTAEQPEQGVFIKGRTNNHRYSSTDQLRVKYGIEQYFVQQGKGLDMEEKLGSRTTLQVPIEMQVALGSDGTAVIVGHRWSQLGVQLEVTNAAEMRNPAEPDDATTRRSPALKVTVKNVSDQPLALANPGDNCAFELIPTNHHGEQVTPASTACAQVTVRAEEVITLSPEESYSVDIDLADPRWHLRVNDEVHEVGGLPVFRQFRLVYHSPTRQEAEQLGVANTLWIGSLPTQAFSNRGRID